MTKEERVELASKDNYLHDGEHSNTSEGVNQLIRDCHSI